MVELPLRYAEAFERLGIEAPKESFFMVPPERKDADRPAIASETKLHFIRVNGLKLSTNIMAKAKPGCGNL